MKKLHLRLGFFALYSLIACTLIGCGANPPKESLQQTTDTSISLDNVTTLLDEADKASNAERTKVYLDVTHALIEAGEADWARNTLSQLAARPIPKENYIRYAVLSAAVAMAQGQAQTAKRILWNNDLNRVATQAPTEERINLHEIRAQLLFGLSEYRASIDERITLHNLLDGNQEENELNQAKLWETLMELPFTDLKLESQMQSEMLAKGWYTLAALSKDNQTNLQLQLEAVERWVLSWPEHPASLNIPADLRLLQQLSDEQPRQIAILLPFSGRFEAASQAIRDGIMAAFYQSAARSDRQPDIRIYDTASEDINKVYDTAVLEGAELIIGPLEKNKIAELALRLELPVPTLALSRLSGPLDYSAGLFQFGLPLEDEAEQVAEQAWRDGHRRAMIFAPPSASGDRSVDSFSARFTELGGEIINDYRYNNPAGFSDLIKTAVKIKDSEERKKQLRSIIGSKIEFEPRRRKDIDFIFLYSQASHARQIKPTLAFHYAGDVPVYAIKDIYNGKTDTKRDKDLNGIRFTTLPWFFDDTLPEKQDITRNSRTTSYQFLYALGVDAYHLHPRLRQLMEVKQAHFYGATGKLHLDEKQKIKREQVWAQFENGTAIPVVTFSPTDDF